MADETAKRSDRPTWYRALLRGINTTATGNAPAFGYSITITVAFGIVSTLSGSPSVGQMIGFGLAAVAAFSVLNIVTTALVRTQQTGDEPSRVVLIATATNFLAVGAGVLVAIAVSWALGGWPAWLLAPFLSGVVYALVQAVELMVGERRAV